jgi:CDP-glucose 4,6-dehydratase
LINPAFWNGRKVLVTGHTGFKGVWLCLWLHSLGAEVHGYSLEPPTVPNLYELAAMDQVVRSTTADVRDGDALSAAMLAAAPEIVVHMAAQPLVRDSYKIPVETYAVNVMGTVNVLEAVRRTRSVRAVVNVTTDKCYENKEWIWGYRECEPLGGYDPYSSSKSCSELVTAAYRTSYFHPDRHVEHGVGIATARAGNVIGGGDWAVDRIIPDCIRAILMKETIQVRNPQAIRPWQHVLEPLAGYLLLAQRLVDQGARFAEAWNFGPSDDDARSVAWLVETLCKKWGTGASWSADAGVHPHEAGCLKLDSSKARARLGWKPRGNIDRALESIVAWTRDYLAGADLRATCLSQIESYQRGTDKDR